MYKRQLYVRNFLQRRGFDEDDAGLPVLKCTVRSRSHSRKTYAFVVVRSKQMADAILYASHSLGGRSLLTGPSKHSRRQRVGISPGFDCRSFQLCAEWPPGELTCLWEVSSCVSFQVSRCPTAAVSLLKRDLACGHIV